MYTSGYEESGWIDIDLSIDWLGYAVPSIGGSVGCVTFFPWAPLRRAWARLRADWTLAAKRSADGFRVVESGKNNNGYVTRSIAVPRRVLLDAVRDSMTVEITTSMIGGRR